jgi:pimeloyl-ACP methyl ester carboxylesterase
VGGRIRSDVEPSEVRYARTVDGVNIAYQVRGDGPVDLVYTLGMAGTSTSSSSAVLDAAGSERAVLVGTAGGSLAAFFAAMHPDRVFALVLYNARARTAWAPDSRSAHQ